MKIQVYVIDFETSRWLRKALAYGVPTMVVLGVAAVVIAAPVQWGASEMLTLVKMNAITVVTTDAGSYSVGATKYCGTGPTNTTGAISYNGATGYAGAKAMCQASSGCGSSATAHMCTTEELARSAQMEIAIPDGWYSGAIYPVSIGSSNVTSACYVNCIIKVGRAWLLEKGNS